MCIYRDQKNIERFALAIQCLTCICVSHLKNLRFTLKPPSLESETGSNTISDPTSCSTNSEGFENSEKSKVNSKSVDSNNEEVSGNLCGTNQRRPSNRSGQFQNQLLKSNEQWTVEETERMLQYMAKIFMMQFPLYSGPKQAGQRNEEVNFKHPINDMQFFLNYANVHGSLILPLIYNIFRYQQEKGHNLQCIVMFMIHLENFLLYFSETSRCFVNLEDCKVWLMPFAYPHLIFRHLWLMPSYLCYVTSKCG